MRVCFYTMTHQLFLFSRRKDYATKWPNWKAKNSNFCVKTFPISAKSNVCAREKLNCSQTWRRPAARSSGFGCERRITTTCRRVQRLLRRRRRSTDINRRTANKRRKSLTDRQSLKKRRLFTDCSNFFSFCKLANFELIRVRCYDDSLKSISLFQKVHFENLLAIYV